MVTKKHPNRTLLQNYEIELTDWASGEGKLRVTYKKSYFVPNPNPRPPYGTPGYWDWSSGTTVYTDFVAEGSTMRESYFTPTFWLKRYEDGTILPSSQDGATRHETKEGASDLVEAWIAAGCPGIGFESAEQAKQRKAEERSAARLSEIRPLLRQLTLEDLNFLSEKCLELVAGFAEREEKEREKVRAREAKAAAKLAEAAQKQAAREAKAAAKLAEAAQKQAAREAKTQARATKLAEAAQKQVAREAKKAEREAKKAAASASA